MKRLFFSLFGALLVMGWLDGVQVASAYDPPSPPRGFQAPPTPAPAALPPAATPAPSPEPDARRDSAGTRLFLPFLTLQLAWPQTSQTAKAQDANPLTERFLYTIKPGDTLADLAVEFGRDVKSMSCVRTESGDEVMRLIPGQRIVIPALTDLCHIVKAGQTLEQIAAWYGVTPQALMAVPENHLASDARTLQAGQTLLIPHARSRYRSPEEVHVAQPRRDGWWYGDGEFIWPLPRGSFWISQRFKHGKHMALDMAAPLGTPVYAADMGRVVKAGWSEIGYGYRVIIDHGIDYITLYAHLSEYYVQSGDIVQKGEIIGRVGTTGNSTGPHLHFEIRDYGYLIDPLLVLP